MEDWVPGNPEWERWFEDLRRRNRIAVEEARQKETARIKARIQELEAILRVENDSFSFCNPVDVDCIPLDVDRDHSTPHSISTPWTRHT